MVDWLLIAAPWVGLGLAILGAIGFVWALAPGHSAKRRRCQKCWYDMSATRDSLWCPECGRVAKSERRLQRRKRRWRMALLGVVVMVLGGAAAAAPDVVRGTWPRLVPTSVLYAMVGNGWPGVWEELEARFNPSWSAPPWAQHSFWTGWPLRMESGMLRTKAHHAIRVAHTNEEVGLAIKCLTAIGPSTTDLPVLRTLIHPTAQTWNRYAATEAISELGPAAAVVVPELIEGIENPQKDLPPWAEINALKEIGPAAAPAVENLRRLMWSCGLSSESALGRTDSYRDTRGAIIPALGAIGPEATRAIPDILQAADQVSDFSLPALCAIANIDPAYPELLARGIDVFLGSDVQAHELFAESLAAPKCGEVRTGIVSSLISRLNSPDGCERISAVRGLASLDAIPIDSVLPLVVDADPTIRLITTQWVLRSAVTHELKSDTIRIVQRDPDSLIRELARKGHSR